MSEVRPIDANALKKAIIDLHHRTKEYSEADEAVNNIIEAICDDIDNAKTIESYKQGYQKGYKVGCHVGHRTERTMITAYLEGKTKEEDEIEQMVKSGEFEAIPYIGETAEEEPNA